jgi:chorismate mutase
VTDAELDRFRSEISVLDHGILDAVNRRIALVAALKAYKDANDIAFLDEDREAAMLDDLLRRNDGPLSDDGVRELLAELLALTKRELDR